MRKLIRELLSDDAQIEAAAEEQTRNERLGTDVVALPDAELFFIDKVVLARLQSSLIAPAHHHCSVQLLDDSSRWRSPVLAGKVRQGACTEA